MDQLLFFVYFFYGLAFVWMGIAMLLESGRSPGLAEARLLRPLAAFGLIHGTHEWLESYLIQARALGQQMPAWLPWLQLGLLVVSFVPLMTYAVLTLLQVSPRLPSKRLQRFSIFGLYAIGLLISASIAYRHSSVPWQPLIDGMTRYLLAVPAAMLAALALRAQGRSVRQEGRHTLASSLLLASYAFGIYGLAQLFISPLAMFPASVLNKDSFLTFSGVPIQAVRGVMATLITIGLVRGAQVVERERRTHFMAIQQAQLEAVEQRDALRRDLLRHTVQAQEDERARVARELHDETAQVLSAFSLELAGLRNQAKRNPRITGTVDRLQELSRSMSQGLYRMVHGLRPALLDDLGLAPALRSMLEQDSLPLGLRVSIKIQGEARRLEPAIETVLYRVAQEAIKNVARHAQVQMAEITIIYQPDMVALQVEDKGAGFDPSAPLRPPHGWGLEGMRERADAAGGKLEVRSAPGQGTTVEIIIPIQEETQETGHENDPVDAGR